MTCPWIAVNNDRYPFKCLTYPTWLSHSVALTVSISPLFCLKYLSARGFCFLLPFFSCLLSLSLSLSLSCIGFGKMHQREFSTLTFEVNESGSDIICRTPRLLKIHSVVVSSQCLQLPLTVTQRRKDHLLQRSSVKSLRPSIDSRQSQTYVS